MTMQLQVSEQWRQTFPGASAGMLAVSRVVNPKSHPGLDEVKIQVSKALREAFSDRAAIKAHPVMQAYAAHYKRFKKTYHVQHQVESVALKGRDIPRVAVLVEAMFMAELKNMLLTAGHDLASLEAPLSLMVSEGGENFVTMSGKEQELKAGDMYIRDQVGIISDVIYGPDNRSRITPQTTAAVFCTYAPAGIGADLVRAHLEDIAIYARIISPQAEVEALEVVSA